MAPWLILESLEQLDSIADSSSDKPSIIFKHSTTCPISSIAKLRLDDHWDIKDEVDLYYLDLIKYRNISNEIASKFEIVHESPQVLVIKDGRCVYDVSHMDINVQEVKDGLLED